MSDFLGKTLDVLAEEIKNNKVVIQNKVCDKETIIFNPAYLESILLNFTSNAIRYSHPDRTPVISYSLSSNKYHKVLEIEDNGPGIPLDIREKIWDPFFTTKDQGEGSGLGLGIVKGIIEKHKGKISVSSIPGRTIFKIQIPHKTSS